MTIMTRSISRGQGVGCRIRLAGLLAGAVATLGYSALDRGHHLEALEYFDTVWGCSPETRTQNPRLAMSIALCRKMLGQGPQAGERVGLIGHWKLDEASGNKAADSSGFRHDGIVQAVQLSAPQWTQGKIGGALHVEWQNWAHVAFVKRGQEVKLFLDGKLDLRETLKAPALKNTNDGKLLHTMKAKSSGDFGEHGRASAAVQNGALLLLGKNTLVTGMGK